MQRLRGEAAAWNADQREYVEKAIRETCEFRNWLLRAVNGQGDEPARYRSRY